MADNFTITGQKQNVAINPAGSGFTEVWDITYRITAGPSKGTVATVTVPDSDHNADYIKNAIEQKIQSLDAIASL